MCLGAGGGALAAGGSGGPDPAVKQWPNWPGQVSCSGPPFKPLVVFSGPTDAERGNRPSEVALREVLAEGLYADFGAPKHNWRLLVETSGYAQFASGRLGHRAQTISVARRGKGWEQIGYSSNCEPAVLRGGRQAITWALAPGQHLSPTTQSIEVELLGGECDSGQSENERLETPVFREESGAVLMALWIRPVHGPQTCQALIEPPVTIQLPEPLGQRRLLDGSVFPPAPPVRRES